MLFAVIGNPISHSKSPCFFNDFFKNKGLKHRYDAIQLSDIRQLDCIIRNNNDLYGVNVTSPFKRDVIKYINHISDEAKDIDAVNVIRIERDGDNYELYGYNTDCLALYDIFSNLDFDRDKKVIILGTGGASCAVSWALTKLGIKNLFVSRTKYIYHENIISYNDIDKDLLDNVSMIVNATPLGLDGISLPDIDYNLLSNQHICFDLIYNPEVTPFLSKSSKNGACTINGYQMFELQAKKSWDIWSAGNL